VLELSEIVGVEERDTDGLDVSKGVMDGDELQDIEAVAVAVQVTSGLTKTVAPFDISPV